MTQPKFSIITVVFNNESTILDTVNSVSTQTFQELEYLIIDGQSTDGTLNRLRECSKKVSNLISEADNGIYDAMNKGIGVATGDIIGFINADDFYASSDVLTKIAAVFNDSNIDACYGDLCYVKQNDTSTVVRYWKSTSFQPTAFEVGWCPPHPTFFVRREIYERFGGFDLSYKIAADVELMMRFLEVHQVRVKYIPEVLVMMRMGGTTNRSLTNIIKQNKEILRALKSHNLRSSIARLLCHKLISRGLQFFVRPTQGSV